MIPNSAPMAAVFVRLSTGTLFSRPVAAWSDEGSAMVEHESSLVDLVDSLLPDGGLMGILPGMWIPTYDEMASLLPEPVLRRCRHCSDQLDTYECSTATGSATCGANPDNDTHEVRD
mgnify:FL=1